VRGRPVCSVGGLQAREGPAKFKQKPLFSFFTAAMFGGEEERGTMSFKTTPFCSFLFFFLIKCMKRRRFGENAPFHLNVALERANFKSALNHLLFISIASLPNSVSAPLVGRVFHFSPWPLIYAIEPLIDQ